MSATSVVMFVLISNLVYHLFHHVSELKIKNQITVKIKVFVFCFGTLLFFTFGFGLWWNTNRAATFMERELMFGIVTSAIIIYNIFWSLFYVIKNKNTQKKENKLILFTLATNIFVWGILITNVFRSYSSNEMDIPMFKSIVFTDGVPVFRTMIFVIALFILVMITGYLIFTSSVKALFIDEKVEKFVQVVKFIDRINSPKYYLLVFSIAIMFSFFYFAEADISNLSPANLIVFDKLTSVFHLIASSLFIPVVLNVLLSDTFKK